MHFRHNKLRRSYWKRYRAAVDADLMPPTGGDYIGGGRDA